MKRSQFAILAFTLTTLTLFSSTANAFTPNRTLGDSCTLSAQDQTALFLRSKPIFKNLLAAENIQYRMIGMSWATVAGIRCSSFIIVLKTEADRVKLRTLTGDFYQGLPVITDVDAEPVTAH